MLFVIFQFKEVAVVWVNHTWIFSETDDSQANIETSLTSATCGWAPTKGHLWMPIKVHLCGNQKGLFVHAHKGILLNGYKCKIMGAHRGTLVGARKGHT